MLFSSTTLVLLLLSLAFSVIAAILLYQKLNQSNQDLLRLNKQLNEQQQKQLKLDEDKSDAVAANLAKNRYLSGISHELRTPLNVVMGYAQLLENQADSADPNKEKYTLMRHNCEHLTHLIEGILEFSAIESGKLKLQLDWVNLHDLIEQIILMFKHQAEQKDLKFISHFADNLPKMVKTDHKRLQQILINLLSNAIKFTEQGHVEFGIKYSSQVATFTIKDSGCGIDSSHIQRIFEPFERIEHQNKQVKGTGLGLPITQLLVNLMGGELTVTSKLNLGSEFIVKMMLSPDSHARATISEHKQNNTNNNAQDNSDIRVLVVDDEASHRELICQILQPYDFKLFKADGAEQAQSLIKQHDISLAVVDVAMPGMNGWQLARWLHRKHPKTKTLMLSANPRDIENSQHIHDAYLTKPVKIQQLLNQMNLLLDLGWQNNDTNYNESNVEHNQTTVMLQGEHQTALFNMADIGHINGIENYLNKLHNSAIITDTQLQHLLIPLKHMNLTSFKNMLQHD